MHQHRHWPHTECAERVTRRRRDRQRPRANKHTRSVYLFAVIVGFDLALKMESWTSASWTELLLRLIGTSSSASPYSDMFGAASITGRWCSWADRVEVIRCHLNWCNGIVKVEYCGAVYCTALGLTSRTILVCRYLPLIAAFKLVIHLSHEKHDLVYCEIYWIRTERLGIVHWLSLE